MSACRSTAPACIVPGAVQTVRFIPVYIDSQDVIKTRTQSSSGLNGTIGSWSKRWYLLLTVDRVFASLVKVQ
jgi:hypothetical protein